MAHDAHENDNLEWQEPSNKAQAEDRHKRVIERYICVSCDKVYWNLKDALAHAHTSKFGHVVAFRPIAAPSVDDPESYDGY